MYFEGWERNIRFYLTIFECLEIYNINSHKGLYLSLFLTNIYYILVFVDVSLLIRSIIFDRILYFYNIFTRINKNIEMSSENHKA